MSVDYLIITPSDYNLETLLKRFPPEIFITDVESGGFYIEAENDFWHAWIDKWDHIINGFPTLEDCFTTQEEIQMIEKIINPQFYYITARCNKILNTILSIIANDKDMLICNEYHKIIPGDEFVAKLKSGDKV